MVQRGSNPKVKDKKGNLARSLCTRKTLKDVKKAERAWSKRPEGNKVVFKDWLHVFELEIQTFVNMNDIDKGTVIFSQHFPIKTSDSLHPYHTSIASVPYPRYSVVQSVPHRNHSSYCSAVPHLYYTSTTLVLRSVNSNFAWSVKTADNTGRNRNIC